MTARWRGKGRVAKFLENEGLVGHRREDSKGQRWQSNATSERWHDRRSLINAQSILESLLDGIRKGGAVDIDLRRGRGDGTPPVSISIGDGCTEQCISTVIESHCDVGYGAASGIDHLSKNGISWQNACLSCRKPYDVAGRGPIGASTTTTSSAAKQDCEESDRDEWKEFLQVFNTIEICESTFYHAQQ